MSGRRVQGPATSRWTAAWTVWLLIAVAGLLAADDLQETEEIFNPADPTAAASHIEAMAELNEAPTSSAPLFRLVYDIDWGEGRYSITAELPYGSIEWPEGTGGTGLGDIRLRYFHQLFAASDPGDSIQTVVASLDVFAPTGNAKEGLGIGTWLLAPWPVRRRRTTSCGGSSTTTSEPAPGPRPGRGEERSARPASSVQEGPRHHRLAC